MTVALTVFAGLCRRRLMMVLAFAAIALQPFAAQADAAPAVPFDIVVEPVRSAEGSVRIGIYRDTAGFRKEAQALKVVALPAQIGQMTAHIDDLPAGRYAVMAYHDENANQKLDLRLGMFPIEGYGLSNNPKVFGPPAFDDSAFVIDRPGQRITIEMRY